jgi:Cys-tRNA(Pro) deacylase
MAKEKHVSETPATQFLRQHHIPFTEHPYQYVEHGGATEAAMQLGVDLHQVAKTLIMEDEHARPMIVVMHGDCEVSTKNLARQIDVKKVSPCTVETAQKHSGYLVGGTSPFATRKRMPVWVEASLLEFPVLYLNGGRRGYLIGVPAATLTGLLGAKPVTVGLSGKSRVSGP